MKYRKSDLGRYSGDSALNDNLSLNRCPDCETLFEGDVCPICRKPCPEEMKAGNRAAIKVKKEKAVKGATFTPVYFRWWFLLILCMIGLTPVALILFLVSERPKWLKVTVGIAAGLFFVGQILLFTGAGQKLLTGIRNKANAGVTGTEEEYRSECREITAENALREPDALRKQKVRAEFRVIGMTDYGYGNVYYLCSFEPEGTLCYVNDCRSDRDTRFLAGDLITVYGRFGDAYYDESGELPLIHMAFADLVSENETGGV